MVTMVSVQMTVSPGPNAGLHAACAAGKYPNMAHTAAMATARLRLRGMLRACGPAMWPAAPRLVLLPLTFAVSGAATQAPRD
ncbi:hypothetical protein G6F57_023648 [Rhizopus arrhizus]|nr:hypothetical protein G6F57_023648 [Rhizopus arrhizus]